MPPRRRSKVRPRSCQSAWGGVLGVSRHVPCPCVALIAGLAGAFNFAFAVVTTQLPDASDGVVAWRFACAALYTLLAAAMFPFIYGEALRQKKKRLRAAVMEKLNQEHRAQRQRASGGDGTGALSLDHLAVDAHASSFSDVDARSQNSWTSGNRRSPPLPAPDAGHGDDSMLDVKATPSDSMRAPPSPSVDDADAAAALRHAMADLRVQQQNAEASHAGSDGDAMPSPKTGDMQGGDAASGIDALPALHASPERGDGDAYGVQATSSAPPKLCMSVQSPPAEVHGRVTFSSSLRESSEPDNHRHRRPSAASNRSAPHNVPVSDADVQRATKQMAGGDGARPNTLSVHLSASEIASFSTVGPVNALRGFDSAKEVVGSRRQRLRGVPTGLKIWAGLQYLCLLSELLYIASMVGDFQDFEVAVSSSSS